jgi:hypothetical protein
LRFLVVACLCIITAASVRAADSTAALRDADYLARLTAAEHQLAELEAQPAGSDLDGRRAALSQAIQNLAVTRSLVGDVDGAIETYGRMHALYGNAPAQAGPDDSQNREYVQSTLTRYAPEPAIDAIVRAARDRQIVILNEAHHVPRHRAFGAQLALELRKLGFEYLAMETLAPDVETLARRGYPTVADGSYSDEPLFGDFIRQALRAGYRPIAYEEIATAVDASTDMVARIESREEAQANNLMERVLKRDPRARLFVYVGYSHAFKGFQNIGNRRTAWMAERLRTKSGIDPLCIDQTTVIEPPPGSRDRALLDSMFPAQDAYALVLAERDSPGRFMSPDAARIDIQVFHRPALLVKGRPDWLAMQGHRRPRAIPAKLLPRTGRRLIQAFIAGESADAVPVDQVVVAAGEAAPALFVPPAKIRFAYQD